MEQQSMWEQLVEPLRTRRILVRQTSGPFLWYQDGGATARRGQLWFMFGRDPGTRHLQCWAAERDDDTSTARLCTLGNLLVTMGKGSEQRTLHTAYGQDDAIIMATYARVIVANFGQSDRELQSWRETVAFEEDMAPYVERMFETK